MAGRNWTPEQSLAINAESGTLLLSAAAGSGKTSVLVERIVRKITDKEAPVPPEALLVVTFTNAAAAEMKTRVFSRLAEKMKEEPECRKEYTALQTRLDEMKICTMDSYCISFVRENFHACGVEPDFRILDNGESDVLKKKVAGEIIEKLYLEDEENFRPLTALFDRGRNDDALVEGIIKLSDFSMSEASPDLWIDGLRRHFEYDSPENSEFGEMLKEDIIEYIDFSISLCRSAMNDLAKDTILYEACCGIFEHDMEILCDFRTGFYDMSWDEMMTAMENLHALTGKKKFSAPKDYKDDNNKKSAQDKREKYRGYLKKLKEEKVIKNGDDAEDRKILLPVVNEFIKTVKMFNAELAEQKKLLNAYDFSDILHFTLDQLLDVDAPDLKTPLAREIAQTFNEILIDEYQDTNRAQDNLFLAISKNGKNMFTVGDVKQSIYRFRLASPEIFIEKSDSYPHYDGKAEKSKIILGNNFRSRDGVVDFVNFIFSSLMSRECGEIVYNEDEKLHCSAKYASSDTPDVEVAVIDREEMKSADAEAAFIARSIKEKLNSGAKVFVKDEEFRDAVPGDFCILVRSNKTIVPALTKALRKAGLGVSVNSGEDFFNIAEVRQLVSVLRVIDNPARDVDLLAVMMSPMFGFTADDMVNIRLEGRKTGKKRASLYSSVNNCAVKGNEKCAAFIKKIGYYKKLGAVLTVDKLIREILNDTSFIAVCSAMNNSGLRKNNVRRFLELAENPSAENRRTLGGFVRYLDTLIENGVDIKGAAQSADRNSVTIMTIHGSKGLEFPYVYLAGSFKKFNKRDNQGAFVISHENGIGLAIRDAENSVSYDTLSSLALKSELNVAAMSEELRVFYVALTRAKEKLCIVMAPDNLATRLDTYNSILPECPEIPPFLVKTSVYISDWFLMTSLLHPDGGALRNERYFRTDTDSKAYIHIVNDLAAVEEDDEVQTAEIVPDEELVEDIKNRAEYSYAYAPVASALSKHTASSVNEETFSTEYFAKSVPAFMSEVKATPADIGTATHRFLQYCDFSVCETDPESERRRLIESGRLDKFLGEQVDTEAVKVFVNSEVMQRCEKAEAIYREKQFTMAKSVCDMDASVPDEFRDERTVIIGKIDMIFVENGKAVIVDYKTDNIKDISVLKERYSDQLKLYSEAVTLSMGLEVEECILYSLKLKDFIKV